MTLDEAIKHFEEVAEHMEHLCGSAKYAVEYKQLAEWLKELKKDRQIKYIHWCDDCSKAYDDTCSGADAAKCEAEKNQFLRKVNEECIQKTVGHLLTT